MADVLASSSIRTFNLLTSPHATTEKGQFKEAWSLLGEDRLLGPDTLFGTSAPPHAISGRTTIGHARLIWAPGERAVKRYLVDVCDGELLSGGRALVYEFSQWVRPAGWLRREGVEFTLMRWDISNRQVVVDESPSPFRFLHILREVSSSLKVGMRHFIGDEGEFDPSAPSLARAYAGGFSFKEPEVKNPLKAFWRRNKGRVEDGRTVRSAW